MLHTLSLRSLLCLAPWLQELGLLPPDTSHWRKSGAQAQPAAYASSCGWLPPCLLLLLLLLPASVMMLAGIYTPHCLAAPAREDGTKQPAQLTIYPLACRGARSRNRVTRFNPREEQAVGWQNRHCLQGGLASGSRALRAAKLHNAKCLHLRSSAVVSFFDG